MYIFEFIKAANIVWPMMFKESELYRYLNFQLVFDIFVSLSFAPVLPAAVVLQLTLETTGDLE